MSLLSFSNELLFGTGSETHVLSGIAGLGTSKLLYNSTDFDGNTTVITTSAIVAGTVYEMDIAAGYHGKTLAVIDNTRFSTQFVFTSGGDSKFQTASATGYISVSPTTRRLYQLGYL